MLLSLVRRLVALLTLGARVVLSSVSSQNLKWIQPNWQTNLMPLCLGPERVPSTSPKRAFTTVRVVHTRPLRLYSPRDLHRLSCTLAARFILGLRAYEASSFHGADGQNSHSGLSASNVQQSTLIMRGGEPSSSLADEFGEDPMRSVRRSTHSDVAVPQGEPKDEMKQPV